VNWFKHAFAVDAPGPAEPTDAQREVVDRLLREVVRRKMATPALMLLEMSRPLNYVTAQALHFFHPVATVVLNRAGYEQFVKFLEQRGSIDYLCRRLEQVEDDSSTESEKPAKGEPNDS